MSTPHSYCRKHGAALPCHVCPPVAPTTASPEPEGFTDPTEADRARGDFGIGFAASATRYAEDIGEPEMPEGWTAVCAVPGAPVAFRRNGPGYRFVTLETIRALLATQGLTVVDEASAKVLEACAAMADGEGERDEDDEPGEPVELGEDCYIYTDDQRAIAKAELARREKEKT